MKMYAKANETANSILKAFQNPEALPAALATVFIHRDDNSPCRKWSWRNQLLTALAQTQDARGYKQWQEVDRYVKKGAKAFHILSPCTKKIKDDNGEDKTIVYGFRSIPVFRLEDTEGADIPSGNPELDKWIAELPLRDVAESWGISVTTFNAEGGNYLGYYQGSKDGVSKAIALGVQNVEVFLHELMHAADYHLGNATEKGQHWRKEVVAEFGSAVLAECLGLEQAKNLGHAFKYIEKYATDSEQTVQSACMKSLDRICKAVALVLDTAESLKNQPAVAVA